MNLYEMIFASTAWDRARGFADDPDLGLEVEA
jgi:hypothetical protein